MSDFDLLQQSGILALVGILLGWILSSISATWRFRNDRKADLSKAVSRLLPELFKIENLEAALEGFKDTAESWAEYERTRRGLWQRHGTFFEDTEGAAWTQLIDNVAKHKPFVAIEIRSLIHLAKKLRENDLAGTSRSSPDAYVKLLSALEVAQRGLKEGLEKVTRSLSWSAGVRSGLGFEWFMRRRGGGSELRRKNANFVKRFHLDVWEEIASAPPSDEALKD